MAETTKKKSVFETLSAINCNEHTEKKNGLTYLSWAWAWQIVKQNYPDAYYTIYENEVGWNYFTDNHTCWVKTGVTIEGLEHIEYLPVMDFKNASITQDRVTSFDVNKAIQRSLTKAVARHGLGLYIYAGEDLPDAADDANREAVAPKKSTVQKAAPAPKKEAPVLTQELYDKLVAAHVDGKLTNSGKTMREYFMYTFHPTQEQMDNFDLAVHDLRRSRNA